MGSGKNVWPHSAFDRHVLDPNYCRDFLLPGIADKLDEPADGPYHVRRHRHNGFRAAKAEVNTSPLPKRPALENFVYIKTHHTRYISSEAGLNFLLQIGGISMAYNTPLHKKICAWLDDEGKTTAEIATEFHISVRTAASAVARLVTNGYIIRSPNGTYRKTVAETETQRAARINELNHQIGDTKPVYVTASSHRRSPMRRKCVRW